VTPEERLIPAQVLPPDAIDLFDRMPVDAQHHSLNVLRAVREMGLKDPDLDAAALLHDVGKLSPEPGGQRLGLWLRGPLVLLDATVPGLLTIMAKPEPDAGWRYTVYAHREHPRIGAEWASGAGCSDLTCWLIRHHQDKLNRLNTSSVRDDKLHLLAALQEADNSS